MAASIIYETNFWLAINIILVIVIIGLVYRQYTSMRQNARAVRMETRPDLGVDSVVEKFRQLLAEGRIGDGIIESYKLLFERLAGKDMMPHLTYREILDRRTINLTGEILVHLKQMYEVYERVRFGGHSPTQEEADMYLKSLEAVNAHYMVLRSVIPNV
ncbi:MAG: hypothetical protein QXV62_08155 [Nitrososphaerota archaeon]